MSSLSSMVIALTATLPCSELLQYMTHLLMPFILNFLFSREVLELKLLCRSLGRIAMRISPTSMSRTKAAMFSISSNRNLVSSICSSPVS